MSERPTTILAISAMAGASAMQALAAVRSTDTKVAISNALGSTICLIAFIHYQWIVRSESDVMAIRYSDWCITLPLLLLDIFLICGVDLGENAWLCMVSGLLIFAMLLAGWYALRSQRNHPTNAARHRSFLVLGCLCLAIVYFIVLGLLDRTKTGLLPNVAISGLLLWSLYGIVAFFRDTGTNGNVQYMYDILDVVTKAIFGIVVAFSTL
jgi:bacteriorhodopsin